VIMVAITLAELVPGWPAARAWTIGEAEPEEARA
jgi:hypothetical protein